MGPISQMFVIIFVFNKTTILTCVNFFFYAVYKTFPNFRVTISLIESGKRCNITRINNGP